MTVDGALTWYGGTMSGTGTTIANGTMALGTSATNTASSEQLVGWTLNDFSPATESYDPPGGGVGFTLGSGATFNNEAGAALTFVSNVGIGAGNGGGTVVNAGTLSKTGGTGTSTIANGVTLTDTGTIEAQTGTLSFQGATSVATGDVLAVSASAVLAIDGATTLAGGIAIMRRRYVRHARRHAERSHGRGHLRRGDHS